MKSLLYAVGDLRAHLGPGASMQRTGRLDTEARDAARVDCFDFRSGMGAADSTPRGSQRSLERGGVKDLSLL